MEFSISPHSNSPLPRYLIVIWLKPINIEDDFFEIMDVMRESSGNTKARIQERTSYKRVNKVVCLGLGRRPRLMILL